MRNRFCAALMLLLGLAPAVLRADDVVKAAGCYIANEYGVVMAIGRFHGRLQLPAGGREAGESPACTARRETLEETGLVVAVGERVATRKRGRFVLFRCIPERAINAETVFEPLDSFEVSQVVVLNPLTLVSAQGARIDTPWRFEEDREILEALFRRGEPEPARPPPSIDCADAPADRP